jgi:hypothetical protein
MTDILPHFSSSEGCGKRLHGEGVGVDVDGEIWSLKLSNHLDGPC